MSRRRKDKKKRKALKEDQQTYFESVDAAESEVEESFSVAEPDETEIEQFAGNLALEEIQENEEPALESDTESQIPGDRWLSRNRENLLLGILVLYVLLLGLGTAGELFEIEWVLNLPIFK